MNGIALLERRSLGTWSPPHLRPVLYLVGDET